MPRDWSERKESEARGVEGDQSFLQGKPKDKFVRCGLAFYMRSAAGKHIGILKWEKRGSGEGVCLIYVEGGREKKRNCFNQDIFLHTSAECVGLCLIGKKGGERGA